MQRRTTGLPTTPPNLLEPIGLMTAGAAALAICTGFSALVGWLNDIATFRSFLVILPAIKPNAAVGVVAGGIALLFLGPFVRMPYSRIIAKSCAIFLLLLGSLTALEYLLGINLNIHNFLFYDRLHQLGMQGRMALITAVNFILFGWAFLVIDRSPKHGLLSLSQILALVSTLGPLTSLLSYCYGVRGFLGSGVIYFLGLMALPMAVASLSLSLGTLLVRPNMGAMRTLTQSTFASYSMRMLLIPALLVPPILSGLLLMGVHQLFIIPGFGAAVLTVLGIVVLATAVWRTVSGLEDLEMRDKLADLAIRKSEKDFSTLFDLVPTGMGQVDPDTGRFYRVNQKLCEMTGYTESELLRTSFRDLTHPDDDAKTWSDFCKGTAKSGQQYTYQKRYIRKDGSCLWVEVSGYFLCDSSGGNKRSIGLIQDLTKRKEEEENLQRAKKMAEEANASKSAFLANMSHELRTPLGAVAGFTELLQEDDISPEDRKIYLATIKRNTDVLTRLIDDILDLSKVEAGKADIEVMPVSISELLTDVSAVVAPKARAKNLGFDWVLKSSIPDKIMTDQLRLRQILLNVIGNAIKFTHAGAVTIEVFLHQKDSLIVFAVKDTGVGITRDHLPRLFQRFSQADGSFTRRYGGTGLGLALSRQLAHALGGDLELSESAVGEGSVFTVSVAAGYIGDVPLITELPASIS